MFNFGTASGPIFDAFTNVYLLYLGSLLLALIIAFYLNDFFVDQWRWQKRLANGDRMEALQREQDNNNEFELVDVGLAPNERRPATRADEKTSVESENSDEDEGNESDATENMLLWKSAARKELEAQLTQDQLEEERRIEREQLAAIFELIKKQEQELNMKEIDEDELVEQLRLYR